MSVPKRVCIKVAELRKRGYDSFEEWVKNKEHLYIGRNMSFYVKGAVASPFGNPFKIGKYTLEESLALYKDHLRNSKELMKLLSFIVSERKIDEIGCWCLPGKKCHGDVIIKIIKQTMNKNGETENGEIRL